MTVSLPSLLPPGHVHLIVVCCVYCVCVCVLCVCVVWCVCVCVMCLRACAHVLCVCACVCACVVCVHVCVLHWMNVCGERGGGVWKE